MYQPQRLCLSKTLLAMARVSLSHHETVPVPPTRVVEPRAVQPSCLRPRTLPVLPPPLLPLSAPSQDEARTFRCCCLPCRCSCARGCRLSARRMPGGYEGEGLACTGGAGCRCCRCCRRRRDLRWRRTWGWGRHARVSLFVAVLARDPFALLALQMLVPLCRRSLPVSSSLPLFSPRPFAAMRPARCPITRLAC